MTAVFRKIDQDSGLQDVYISESSDQHVPDQHHVTIDVKACAISHITPQILLEVFKKRPFPQYPACWEVSGVVTQLGSSVTSVRVGDRVAGLLPLDSTSTACAESCTLYEFDLVKLPDNVSHEAGAACVGDGLKAYTALFYQARVTSGETVLVTDTGAPWISLAVQIAQSVQAKVIAAVKSGKEKSYLQNLNPPVENILELGDKTNILFSSVMEETGGLGADIILDNGVKLFTKESDNDLVGEDVNLPSKHELISCLGIGGRWVTSHSALQLDPPNGQALHLRGASVSFLFEHTWTLTAIQQGRMQHILQSVLKKVSNGEIKPNITKIVMFEDAVEAIKSLDNTHFGKVVIKINT